MPATAVQLRAPDEPAPALADVFVIDDLLREQERRALLDFLRGGDWEFGWKSSRKTDPYSFWHKHFAGYRSGGPKYDCADELRSNSPLIFAFWQYLAEHIFPRRTLVRCYANAQSYGTDGTLHTDSRQDDSYTAVYYPHLEWEPNWAGETVLFNADKSDIVTSIYPKPNRLLVFKGSTPHLARGVSRTCPELRITLMFKTGTPDDQRAA